MANVHYDPYINAYMTGGSNLVDFDSGDIRAILVDGADYTFSAAHDFLDDVPGAARVATQALSGESVTNRTFDASDTTFTAVSGDSVEMIILYQHTGTESTSRLIAKIDTATNLPFTPNGGDVVIAWDNGSNKILSL